MRVLRSPSADGYVVTQTTTTRINNHSCSFCGQLIICRSSRLMPAYKLVVSYLGTRFHGFQRQIGNAAMTARQSDVAALRPKKRPHYVEDGSGKYKHSCLSVQEVFEMLLLEMYPATNVDSICLRFAGRTDKGVHANGQVVTLNLPESSPPKEADQAAESVIESCFKLRNSINSRLPFDVSVQAVEPVDPDFNPRKNVKRKQYTYTLKYRRKVHGFPSSGPHTLRHAMDPLCLWQCPWPLDDSRIDALLPELRGAHDYSNFVHKHDRQKKDQNLTIDTMQFNIQTVRLETLNGVDAPIVTAQFVFEAPGFRRTMIRNLVGYMVDVSRDAEWAPPIDTVLFPNDAVAAKIHAAPADGLCLESVTY